MSGRWITISAAVCGTGLLFVCAFGSVSTKPSLTPARHPAQSALATNLSGAHLVESSGTSKAGEITYTRDIAPILYQNCAECHREGEVAPFPLVTYDDAAKRAHLIEAVTASRYMPPWKADPQPCAFVGERRLTDDELAAIKSWAIRGAPEGNAADLLALPSYPSTWRLGRPDVVLQPSAPYHLAADGSDVYRCFVLPTASNEDRFLSAVEIHPGNGHVVHHVIVYLDSSGRARQLAGNDPSHSYTSFGGPGFPPSGAIGGWVPGDDTKKLPDGIGYFLPKNADIVLQVHYHKDGKPEDDLTQIGLFYTTAPVDKRVRTLMVINPFIRIPGGAPNYGTSASYTVPEDVTVLGVTPHMHLLGHDMTVTARRPDGSGLQLVKVPDWDFNWQLRYAYQQPFQLPKGSIISLTAHYDNTTSNPRNPNSPPHLVTWGEQTTDEMCIAFVTCTVDSEHLTRGVAAKDRLVLFQSLRDEVIDDIFREYDTNHDGKLDASELQGIVETLANQGAAYGREPSASFDPAAASKTIIALFDVDGDGTLDRKELGTALQFLQSLRGKSGQNSAAADG